jgi:hypothetical protein
LGYSDEAEKTSFGEAADKIPGNSELRMVEQALMAA